MPLPRRKTTSAIGAPGGRGCLVIITLGAALACIGCDRAKTRVYREPKEAAAAFTVDGGPAPEAPGAVTPAWTIPAGWRADAPQSFNVLGVQQSELAAFLLGPAGSEIRLTVTSGQGPSSADVLLNVNRWRAQLSLPALAGADPEQAATIIPLPNATAYLVDLSGTPAGLMAGPAPHPPGGAPPGARILAALVVRPSTGPAATPPVWTFKLVGPEALVAAHATEFHQFIASIRFPQSP